MTDRALQVYEYIKWFRSEKGIAPTYRELSKACNIPSTSLVRYYLDQLEREGLIERRAGVARGIVLVGVRG